jgi:hypothetical protein
MCRVETFLPDRSLFRREICDRFGEITHLMPHPQTPRVAWRLAELTPPAGRIDSGKKKAS